MTMATPTLDRGLTDGPQHHLHPRYRADIDGLRAIAVLCVLGYHAAPGRVPGGFIGVDVFFIISGYLISTIIFSNLERGSFSLLDFYARRIRRIFPALLTVLLASLALGWFALVADEYGYLGKHTAGGAAFLSNALLYGESGYFGRAAEAKPMLHLWSLAIEEQFYLFWPVTLLFVWQRRWNFLWTTAAVGVLSFAANIYLSWHDPSAAFYWPISRFWELMLGGVLAYLTLHRPGQLASSKNAQSAIGLALFVAGLLFIDRSAAFPGWWALLPTGGTFLLISAGPDAWMNKHLLSNRLLVGVGLISYPLYLWHWPLLSFARIIAGGEVPVALRVGLLLLSVVLSGITYAAIERPLRFRAGTPGRTLALLAALLCVGALGLWCYALGGFVFRSTQPRVANQGDIGHEQFLKRLGEYPPCSDPLAGLRDDETTECRQSLGGKPVEIAVLGDSHAAHVFIALATAWPNTNVAVLSAGGLPLASTKEFARIYPRVLADNDIHTIILVARWSARVDSATFEQHLTESARALAASGKRTYITNDGPDFGFDPVRCKYAGRLGVSNHCTESIQRLHAQLARYQPSFESAASHIPRLSVLHTAECFCDTSACSMARDGQLLYRDDQHLNLNGARFLGRCIQEHYPELGTPPAPARQPLPNPEKLHP